MRRAGDPAEAGGATQEKRKTWVASTLGGTRTRLGKRSAPHILAHSFPPLHHPPAGGERSRAGRRAGGRAPRPRCPYTAGHTLRATHCGPHTAAGSATAGQRSGVGGCGKHDMANGGRARPGARGLVRGGVDRGARRPALPAAPDGERGDRVALDREGAGAGAGQRHRAGAGAASQGSRRLATAGRRPGRLPAPSHARLPRQPPRPRLRRRRRGPRHLRHRRRRRRPGARHAAGVVLARVGAALLPPGAGRRRGGPAAVPAVQGAAGPGRASLPRRPTGTGRMRLPGWGRRSSDRAMGLSERGRP